MRFPEMEQCELRSDEAAAFRQATCGLDLIDLHTNNLPLFNERSPFSGPTKERFIELTRYEGHLSVHALALYANAAKRFDDIANKLAPGGTHGSSWELKYISGQINADPLYQTYIEDARHQAVSDRS